VESFDDPNCILPLWDLRDKDFDVEAWEANKENAVHQENHNSIFTSTKGGSQNHDPQRSQPFKPNETEGVIFDEDDLEKFSQDQIQRSSVYQDGQIGNSNTITPEIFNPSVEHAIREHGRSTLAQVNGNLRYNPSDNLMHIVDTKVETVDGLHARGENRSDWIAFPERPRWADDRDFTYPSIVTCVHTPDSNTYGGRRRWVQKRPSSAATRKLNLSTRTSTGSEDQQHGEIVRTVIPKGLPSGPEQSQSPAPNQDVMALLDGETKVENHPPIRVLLRVRQPEYPNKRLKLLVRGQ